MFKVRKGLVPLTTGLVVAALLSGCAGQQLSWGQGASTPTPSASASSSTTPTPKPSSTAPASATLQQANASVTVKSGALNWTYPARNLQLVMSSPFGFTSLPVDQVDNKGKVVGTDVIPVFQTASTQPTTGDQPRLFSDAVAPAWCGQSIDSVSACVLGFPDYAAMVCTGLYNDGVFHTAIGDVSLPANNPWLADCGSSAAQINDWAGHAENANTAGLVQYAKTTAKLVELLTLLTVTGKGDGTTVLNYHLAVVGPNNVFTVNPYAAPGATIPEFELGPNYTGKSLFMNVSIKGQPIGCDPIGFNIGFGGIVDKHGNGGDGRFARFACPPTPPAPTTYTPPSGPGCIYGLNSDGECIPPKNADPNQTHPTEKPIAPVNPVQPVQPHVDPNPPVVVVPQIDQGGGGNGVVTG
jgi:hypothetical protein